MTLDPPYDFRSSFWLEFSKEFYADGVAYVSARRLTAGVDNGVGICAEVKKARPSARIEQGLMLVFRCYLCFVVLLVLAWLILLWLRSLSLSFLLFGFVSLDLFAFN